MLTMTIEAFRGAYQVHVSFIWGATTTASSNALNGGVLEIALRLSGNPSENAT